MGETKTKGEKWLDIGMGWLVRYEHSDTWMSFKAYEVMCTAIDGTDKQFHLKGARDGMSSTPDPDKADCLDGFVKWDGCCEIDLGQPHWCGAGDVAQFCEVVRELHKLCLLLPSVDHDCAGYPETQNGGTDG